MPFDTTTLSQLLNAGGPQSLPGFAVNLVLAAALAMVLGQAYVRFGHALSNRRAFARNFLLLTMTTTLIISIVKSSLALSLGLVGALSIVRFRAAIKEPEELAYLFLAISIGLGLGASQPLITVVAFGLILGLIAMGHLVRPTAEPPNLYLSVVSPSAQKLGARQILEALTAAGARASLKRFDESAEGVEAGFVVHFQDVTRLEEFTRRLRGLSDGAKISFVEERGLGL